MVTSHVLLLPLSRRCQRPPAGRPRRPVRRLPQVLEGIEVGAYSLRAWNDAVSYIADRRLTFDAPQDACDFLISFAEKER